MAPRTSRRLPGVRFVATPPLVDPLPRMDIAVFVGFAAEGPLDVPVAIESAAEHAAIFGADPVLAWDPVRAEPVHANLGSAVRAFFRNGGLRCWVVRVARGATANVFPITGLLRAEAGVLTPAIVHARAAGSFSDGLRVGAALLPSPVLLERLVAVDPPEAIVTTTASSEVAVGDLLRFRFPAGAAAGGDLVWMVPVSAVDEVDADEAGGARPPGARRIYRMRVRGHRSAWFRAGAPAAAATGRIAHRFDGESAVVVGTVEALAAAPGAPERARDEVEVVLAAPLADAPDPGSFLRVELGAEELWLRVREVQLVRKDHLAVHQPDSIRVVGPGLRRQHLGLPAWALVGLEAAVERLRFELWTRQGEAPPMRLSALGLAPRHPQFWAALPSDELLFRARLGETDGGGGGGRWQALWQSASAPRYPLAGDGRPHPDDAGPRDDDRDQTFYVPVGMAFAPDVLLGAAGPAIAPIRRDGLTELDAALFLDPALAEVRSALLLDEADTLRYAGPELVHLRGIHAALSIAEATIIAVPDLVHRRWTPIADEPRPPVAAAAAKPSALGDFRDCRIPLDQPVLTSTPADPTGTFTLSWTGALAWASKHVPGRHFVVEESAHPDFVPTAPIYTGVVPTLTIWGRAQGEWYYRVRIDSVAGPGPWSAAVVVRPAAAAIEPADYHPGVLVTVQHALLRMCAARGDLFAVLALPEHYREPAAIDHVAALANVIGGPEAAIASYGAVYHPWLISREETAPELRRSPPEGAIAGVLARRALARGAWIAPANEPLTGVIALSPVFGRDGRQGLLDAQVNLIRHEPAGFLTLSADTLSADADLMPISVRRLLILLRRVAIERGATYLFELNDRALRRRVQRGFEELLGRLHDLGAFAGRTPDTAFQVVTDDGPRSATGAAEGRFTVELKVAPSVPMSFLTVRLVQSGDRSRVTEVR